MYSNNFFLCVIPFTCIACIICMSTKNKVLVLCHLRILTFFLLLSCHSISHLEETEQKKSNSEQIFHSFKLKFLLSFSLKNQIFLCQVRKKCWHTPSYLSSVYTIDTAKKDIFLLLFQLHIISSYHIHIYCCMHDDISWCCYFIFEMIAYHVNMLAIYIVSYRIRRIIMQCMHTLRIINITNACEVNFA